MTNTDTTPTDTPQPNEGATTILRTVAQMAEHHPGALTAGGLRHILFHLGRELEDAGIVLRVGRKILIDEPRYIDWLRSGGAKNIRAKVEQRAHQNRLGRKVAS